MLSAPILDRNLFPVDTTTSTATLYLPQPDLSEMMQAIRLVERRIFDTVVIPDKLMRGLDDHVTQTAERITRQIAEAGPTLWGIQVKLNRLLDDMEWPVRRHRKRKWMSEAYHRRIQKKWNKRFGTGPVAVLLNSDVYLNPHLNRTALNQVDKA